MYVQCFGDVWYIRVVGILSKTVFCGSITLVAENGLISAEEAEWRSNVM